MSTETFFIELDAENDRQAQFIHLFMQPKNKWKDLFESYFNTVVDIKPAENDDDKGKIVFVADPSNEQRIRSGYYSLFQCFKNGDHIDDKLISTLAGRTLLKPVNNNSKNHKLREKYNNSIQDQRGGWGHDNKKPGKGAGQKPKTYFFRPRNEAQQGLVDKINENDLTFGIGPAGTGKTHVAVAKAIEAFNRGEVERIFLARPAIASGKDPGALPGDMREKMAPYMRPLYDELTTVLGDTKKLEAMIENGEIEIAPIEFMRGRTFKNAFVIVDETQNCDIEQVKMALTRLGEGSKMVVTGDPMQVDLKDKSISGLNWALERLQNVPGIGIQTFTADDVVRHPVVARIVQAFLSYDNQEPAQTRPAPTKRISKQPRR